MRGKNNVWTVDIQRKQARPKHEEKSKKSQSEETCWAQRRMLRILFWKMTRVRDSARDCTLKEGDVGRAYYALLTTIAVYRWKSVRYSFLGSSRRVLPAAAENKLPRDSANIIGCVASLAKYHPQIAEQNYYWVSRDVNPLCVDCRTILLGGGRQQKIRA
jgi:hypothetical protein